MQHVALPPQPPQPPQQPQQPQQPSAPAPAAAGPQLSAELPTAAGAAAPVMRGPLPGQSQELWTHPSMLPPAPKSGVKFLPGAVAAPDPPRGGKQSAGRTFSWQPMRMPTYK